VSDCGVNCPATGWRKKLNNVTNREPLNLLWLQSGGCGGCTLSLLNADCSNLFDTLAGFGIRLLWHPSLSEESAQEARRIIDDCVNGTTRLDILCLEGAVLRGPHGSGGFHKTTGGDPVMTLIEKLAGVASHTVAVGSCAAFGGVTSAGSNPADACGLQFEGDAPGGLLGRDFRDSRGLPVINIAGCPTHPNWVIETLARISLWHIEHTKSGCFPAPEPVCRSSGTSWLHP
jgi:Ni,Fe-hydrogenase I small subunit